MTTFLAICIFFMVFCLASGILLLATDGQARYQRRLKKRLNGLQALEVNNHTDSLLQSTVSRFPRLLKGRLLTNLELSLVQAGTHCRIEVFLGVVVLSAAAFLCLGLLKWGLIGALAGGSLGIWLPFKFLAFMKRRRFGKFEKQLPEALELLGRGLKAGHAFTSGLQLVANEMDSPIGPEFFKTYKEHNHGLDLNDALLNLCRRVDLQDLRFFTTAVMIQRETGGNLAEILEKIATLIRERFKLHNQVKALTAEGRLSGLVLSLLPPATALALFIMNSNYIMLLWHTPKGRAMAMIALAFQALGLFSIARIVKIKV
ncbi:MAG: type II secretion system F family protein [Deltaproteobacteria bacterium]|nr:type II secretion system F family protein [Deltaproteobacteria bacterium]